MARGQLVAQPGRAGHWPAGLLTGVVRPFSGASQLNPGALVQTITALLIVIAIRICYLLQCPVQAE
jgi:hypothetical protein